MSNVNPNRPFIVGISGPAGAGKTTLVIALCENRPNFGWLTSPRSPMFSNNDLLRPSLDILVVDSISTPEQRAACDWGIFIMTPDREANRGSFDAAMFGEAEVILVRRDTEYGEFQYRESNTGFESDPISIPAIAGRVLAAWEEWKKR